MNQKSKFVSDSERKGNINYVADNLIHRTFYLALTEEECSTKYQNGFKIINNEIS